VTYIVLDCAVTLETIKSLQFLLDTMMRHELVKTLLRRGVPNMTKDKSFQTLLRMSRSIAQHRLAVSAASVSTPSSIPFDHPPFSYPSVFVATAVAAAGVSSLMMDNNKSDCCGIVGVVGTKAHGDAREFLLDGLTILKNRGYDSAGIATVSSEGGDMSITKYASDGDKADSIELVDRHSHSMGHTLGIAHTRWYVHIIIKTKQDRVCSFSDYHLLLVQGDAWRQD
jgi:hypothetical protein